VRVTPNARYAFGVTYDHAHATADVHFLEAVDPDRNFVFERIARSERYVDDEELVTVAGQLVAGDRVPVLFTALEQRRFDSLVPADERAVPGVEVEDGAVAMSEVAEEPPQALCPAERAVGDDERLGADARTGGGGGELLGGGERMPSCGGGRRGEVSLDVEERGTRNMGLSIGPEPEAGIIQRPPAVHEAVLHL
jgi:hypothetical protein